MASIFLSSRVCREREVWGGGEGGFGGMGEGRGEGAETLSPRSTTLPRSPRGSDTMVNVCYAAKADQAVQSAARREKEKRCRSGPLLS